MTLVESIKGWWPIHIMFGMIFIFSGLIVNFLQLCSCIIWPFSRSLYRKTNVFLAYTSWSQVTFLAEWWSGSDIVLRTNEENFKHFGKEHAIIILNHKYDIEWMMGWVVAERYGVLSSSKVFAKSVLKYVPVIGWAWIFTETIFLRRQWDKDRAQITKDLKNLKDYPVYYWLLMFCEGTRFTKEKHAISMEVAKQKGYPLLKHHLLPRTKGFVLTAQAIKGSVPAIYDCTIGFKNTGVEPTVMNILRGKTCLAELYVRRIPLEDVPTESDEECAAWLHKLYQEKDAIYDEFIQNDRFSGPCFEVPRRSYSLLVCIFWVVALLIPSLYYLCAMFFQGTFLTQLVMTLVAVLGVILVRMMIGVSETQKGSNYGKSDNSR